MARIIRMANSREGVGRTTTTFSIAAGPAKLGSSGLVIDVDLQCHAASGLGVGPVPRTALLAGKSLAEMVADISRANLDARPGSQSLVDVVALSASSRRRASTYARSSPATSRSARRSATG